MSSVAGRTLVIAVVDDDEVDRLAVQRALYATHPSARVVLGETAKEARLVVAREAPDIVFLDLVLPDGDGAAVVAELRCAGFDVPIVVMTGHGDEQTAVEIMKSGASDYIPKAALSAERLAQSIRHALRVREADMATNAARAALEAYAMKLHHLVETSARAHGARTVEGVARVIADAARSIVGTHQGIVRVSSNHGPELRAVALSDRDKNLATVASPDASHSDAGVDRLLRYDTAALQADPAALARARVAGLNLPPRGWLAAPIVSREGHATGVVHLSDKIEGDFSVSDELVLDLLTKVASVAIENAALFESTQAACQARDDMLGVVSHDLRAPLNTIVLAGRLLRDGHVDDAAKRRSHVDRINRSADLMLRLISDLLDVTRIESRLLSIDKSEHPARELVDQAVDSVRELAATAGLKLETCVEGDLPVIAVDRDRILQVLSNLLGNALKFTPRGGTVRVRASDKGDAVVFAVEDTGAGISPSELARVFDRYFQGRTRANLGAGLGLFIAKGIVDAHAGTIHVESQLGKGSTFWFRLPVVAAASSVA